MFDFGTTGEKAALTRTVDKVPTDICTGVFRGAPPLCALSVLEIGLIGVWIRLGLVLKHGGIPAWT
jgi:hypothetical protein